MKIILIGVPEYSGPPLKLSTVPEMRLWDFYIPARIKHGFIPIFGILIPF
jgi:hypothetical protein